MSDKPEVVPAPRQEVEVRYEDDDLVLEFHMETRMCAVTFRPEHEEAVQRVVNGLAGWLFRRRAAREEEVQRRRGEMRLVKEDGR